ncbi:hypothetical protein NQ317_005289 [Molorchus minor]|uniref:THAP-type domain-containing protein n=1 Tax=Molorchus minor TaxID=1323400 RepID=A0ABQ9IRB2_9CUCU|nr:hypothetical protein NQ317_005289 [Molorchus minor]
MSCAVKNCKNTKRFRPEGIHFHRFPKGQLLHLWKSALGLDENWQRWIEYTVQTELSKSVILQKYSLVISLAAELLPIIFFKVSNVFVDRKLSSRRRGKFSSKT